MDCGRAHLSMDVRSEWLFIFLTDMFRFLQAGHITNAVFFFSLQLVFWGVNVGDLHFRGLTLPRDSRGGTL